MSPVLRAIIAILIVIIAACTPAPQPTATPLPTETPTTPPTETPLPEPTALPSVLELTRASDPSQLAQISVIHAADAPVLDVYIERLAVATNMSFGQSTQPSSIVAGEYFLRVVLAGVRPDSGEFLYESPVALQAGDRLLFMFTGTQDALEMSFFPLQLEPLNRDESRVTVIHAMPGGPVVTVFQDDVQLSSPLPFGNAAFPMTLPPGETMLTFQMDSGPLTTHTLNLFERFSYTLVIAGTAADPRIIDLRLAVPGLANIRALNASSAIGPVDIYLDDDLLVNNLEYTRRNEHQAMAAQVYNVHAYPAGADRSAIEPLVSEQIVANNDDYITLLLMGEPQNLEVVTYREDVSPTRPDESRITFVNPLPQVPRVRIDTQSRLLTEAGDIGYAQQPSAIELSSGTYLFNWMSVENNQTVDLIELAENVVLEPGRSYLYLLTGRILEPPLILSDNIGFDEQLVDLDAGELPTATPEVPTQIRFVNAIKGSLPLDIAVDGQALFAGVGYAATTALVNISPGDHNMAVQFADSGQVVVEDDFTLEASTRYTLVIHGFGTEPIGALLVNDSDVDPGGNSATFRLMNLTIIGDSMMGLAHSVTDPEDAPFNPFSESPQSENFRRSLAFGIELVPGIADVNKGTTSGAILAPAGYHDLHIIDSTRTEVAASIRKINLQPGQHYDVFAFQNPGSLLVEGFVLPYPPG